MHETVSDSKHGQAVPGPPKVARIIAFWAGFNGFGQLFYILLGVQVCTWTPAVRKKTVAFSDSF